MSITVRLLLGALPLLVYPFVAIASVMSLAGYRTGTEPMLRMLVARAFQITSLLYPVVYLGSLIAALSLKKADEAAARKVTTIPFWFLLLIVAAFFGWMLLDRA